MRRFPLPLALIALAIVLPFNLAASSHDDLEEAMESMENSYQALKKQIKDESKRDSSLAHIAGFQKAALTAKGILPGHLDKLPAEEKAKAADAYRAMMVNLLRTALDIEDALLEKRFDDAAKELKTLHDLEDAGHKQFRK